jgi:hypothetical protein
MPSRLKRNFHFLFFEGIIRFAHDPFYSELQIKAVIADAINKRNGLLAWLAIPKGGCDKANNAAASCSHFLFECQIACLKACSCIQTNNAPDGALFAL